MLSVSINRRYSSRTIPVPECWNELDSGQLIAIARILFTEQRPMHRKVALVKAICRLAWYELTMLEAGAVQEQLLPLCDWIEQDCDLTINLLPEIKLKRTTFYGPDDFLKNVRFAEFDFAERELQLWQQKPSETNQLYRFVATLYRPPKSSYDVFADPEGDRREAFNQHLSTGYAAMLEKEMPVHQALAIVLWYKGCRNYIASRHPRIFGTGESSETGETTGYYGLMRAIAKEGIYGTFEQVEQLYLYNALHEMECALDEKEAIEAHLESLKSKS